MKNSIKLIALLALPAAGLVSFSAGCAGTATRQSTGEYVDDAAVTAKVKAALVQDEIVKAMQVDNGWLEMDSGSDHSLYAGLASQGRLAPFFDPSAYRWEAR